MQIVFIHQGTAAYLPTTFLQAAKAAPTTERILLGSSGSWALGGTVKHLPIKRYWRRAAELAKIFVNFSSNAAGFELVCLQRWLALAEYMQTEDLDEVLYLDSDVMLYSPVEQMLPLIPAGAAMTVSGIAAHSNFIRSRAVLEQFGDFILDAYTRPGGIEWLAEQYRLFCQTHTAGGISDMTFFTWFREANPSLVANLAEPITNSNGKLHGFDITLNYTKGYEAEAGLKRITFNDQGHPYAHLLTGQAVRMHTLHFQGAEAKAQIERFATTPAASRHRLRALNSVVMLALKTGRKLGMGKGPW